MARNKLRFIERYKVILLDMMGTFMFGGDRFAEGEDFAATYRALGGGRLEGAQVCAVVGEVYRRLDADYRDPARQEDFASVREYLGGVLEEFGLPPSEALVLDEVFAAHETGRVPESHARALRRLGETHRLGVVSNLWSRGARSLDDFRRAGVADLFEAVVFSSDHRVNKPSPLIFRKAVERLGARESEALFVGNDLLRDAAAAKAVGMAAVWIDAGGGRAGLESLAPASRPDLVIRDLPELLEA
jgi:putative hydrolase of the HAD superfamily